MSSDTTIAPASRTLQLDGFKLHYWDWESSGPTIVLLHSSSHYGRMWEPLARELNPEFRIIAIDQRGHGDTEQPAAGNAPEDYANDVEALAQALGLEQFVIGGEALGSRVALVYGALHPERIRGVVLVGGPDYSTLFPGADVERWTTHAASMRKRPRSHPTREAAYQALSANYRWFNKAALDHELQYNTREQTDGSVAWKYDPDWVADGLLHALDDLREYAAKVSRPVLILRPETSWQLTEARMPEIEGKLPTAKTVTVPGTSAAMGIENPNGVAAALRLFIASLPK